ncbi:hypothetical protein O0L34_g10306 [Tuta absoluta]|nr:hypothetical protein O0L34_g10306 [Tuta absoluta]
MGFFRGVIYVVPLVLVTVHSRSIADSEKNVAKSDTRDDLFPDWVPFKNKRGEELGEFLQVETASKKPKKRLALPVNFLLSSAADAGPEEYFDRSVGDAYGDLDYSDKRDWGDAFVLGKAADTKPVPHTELSEIGNVVGIITKPNTQVTLIPKTKYKERSKKKPKPKPGKNVDYGDDDEDNEKRKTEITGEERRESEARKAIILGAVDELKERHALEQKTISEKAKEEAMYTEERDRDNLRSEIFDKYGQKTRVRTKDYDEDDGKYDDKYKITPLRKTTPPSSTTETTTYESTTVTSTRAPQTGRMSVFRNPHLYMIYDEEETTSDSSTTTKLTSTSTPGSFLSSDSASSSASSEETTLSTKFNVKFIPPTRVSEKETERISLVPQDDDLREGEPTLFFPRKKKRKHHNKTKKQKEISEDPNITSSSEEKLPHNDVLSAGSVPAETETAPSAPSAPTAPSANDSLESASALENIGPYSNESSESPSASSSAESKSIQTGPSSSGETAASAPSEAVPPAEVTGPSTDSVHADVISASSDVKEEKKKDEDHESEKGGETEHHSEHHSEHGEGGKKEYEGYHEDQKTKKGHHDKEDHEGKYNDHGGVDNEHHDERKHYGAHHHEEHGKKHAEYEESGKHSKGHSTKGSHDIHKKDEYEKKVEFFEEEGDSAEEEKHGGHREERGHKKGGHYKKGDGNAGFHDRVKGDSGHFNKASHDHLQKGHSQSAGHDAHGRHRTSNLIDGGKKGGKKWIYHHGFPAKNANLVVIDRRTDQLFHGPQYYG